MSKKLQLQIGEKIKALRLLNNWTQQELANKVGCYRERIAHYEANMKLPSLPRFVELCRAFDVSADVLLEK